MIEIIACPFYPLVWDVYYDSIDIGPGGIVFFFLPRRIPGSIYKLLGLGVKSESIEQIFITHQEIGFLNGTRLICFILPIAFIPAKQGYNQQEDILGVFHG